MAADPVLSKLEDIIGHRFTDSALLETAVTHASFSCGNVGNGGRNDYERLEFLGFNVPNFQIIQSIQSWEGCKPSPNPSRWGPDPPYHPLLGAQLAFFTLENGIKKRLGQ